MKDKTGENKTKKGFFARMIDKLDKKMQEKAESRPCCCAKDKPGNEKCCS